MMKKQKKYLSLASQIFIAMILAIIAGIAMTGNPDFATNYIKPFGTIFLNLIKWIVAPLVFFSIMAGICSMRDVRRVGAIGGKTVLFYLCTTAFAVTIGLIIANLSKGLFPVLETSDLSYEASDPVNFMDTLVNVFPSNFIAPFSNANMLQVIVSALIIGFAVLLIADDKTQKCVDAISAVNNICLKVMEMILKLSPIGVFCLLCPVVAQNGPSILGSLAIVLAVAYVAYAIHVIVVYSATVGTLGQMNPIKFFKGIAPAMIFAFSSASSVGTLPINMKCCEKLGVPRDIISFVLPLGATINMDGTAIYQGVCAVFIASCYGIQLTMGQLVTIVLTATLASIGTAGVPGAGMVMLAMVLESVGLPVEGIALVAGVDRIFDMGRTTVNITGDAACAVVESAKERKMNQNNPIT